MKKTINTLILLTILLFSLTIFAFWAEDFSHSVEVNNNYENQTGSWRRKIAVNIYDHEHNVTDIQTRNSSTLVLSRDGYIFSWGWNSGALGRNTALASWNNINIPSSAGFGTSGHTNPHRVNSDPVAEGQPDINDYFVVRIAVGPFNSLALTDDGQVWATGITSPTGVGNTVALGRDFNRFIPVTIPDNDIPVIDIAAGWRRFMILLADGSVYAWGDGSHGALGQGNLNHQTQPTLVDIPETFGQVVRISAQNNAMFAVTNQNRIWAWGRNDFGQLGDGTITQRTSPVLQAATFNDEEIIDIKSGRHHTWVQTANNIYTWGSTSAALGRPTTSLANRTPGILNFQAGDHASEIRHFSIEHNHALIIFNDGRIRQLTTLAIWNTLEHDSIKEANPILVSIGQTLRLTTEANTNGNGSTAPNLFMISDDGFMWAYGNEGGGALGNNNNANNAINNVQVRVSHSHWHLGPVSQKPFITFGLYYQQIIDTTILQQWLDDLILQQQLTKPRLMIAGIYQNRPLSSDYVFDQTSDLHLTHHFGFNDPIMLYDVSSNYNFMTPYLQMGQQSFNLYIRLARIGTRVQNL